MAEYHSTGTLLRRFIHGLGNDDPVIRYERAGVNARRYLLADERSSIIAEMTANGGLLQAHEYDAYGNPKNSSDARFRFTGQILIPGTELYYYKARVYHPRLGRFMQTDPIGYKDGMNWYAYVGNDPLNGTDPSGKWIVHAVAFAVGAAISGYQTYNSSGGDIGATLKSGFIGGSTAALSLSPAGIARNMMKSFVVGTAADATSQVVVEGKSISDIDVAESLEAGAVASGSTGLGSGVAKLTPVKNMPSVKEPSVAPGRTQRMTEHPGTIASDKAKQGVIGVVVGGAAGGTQAVTEEKLREN